MRAFPPSDSVQISTDRKGDQSSAYKKKEIKFQLSSMLLNPDPINIFCNAK